MLSIKKTVTVLTFAVTLCGQAVWAKEPNSLAHSTVPYGHPDYKIRGVNLGGWLLLEPWITPSLFKQFEHLGRSEAALDEYTFCEKLGKIEAARQLKHHWDTWVTEEDIRKLSTYGLNHIRIPMGYWALDVKPDEPFVQGSFKYVLKAVRWAHKYGLKAIIDIHGVPGSQNGFDNSGRWGPIKWQEKEENVERSTKVVRRLAKVFAHPKYKNTVTMIQPVNEPANWGLDMNKVRHYYDQAHDAVTQAAPHLHLDVHDAFLPLKNWETLRNKSWQKTLLDHHFYHVFNLDQLKMTREQHLMQTCAKGAEVAESHKHIPTMVGEFSLATTDCTKWINGFLVYSRWEGKHNDTAIPIHADSSCRGSEDFTTYSAEHKQFLKTFAELQFDAYEKGAGWIFWNFKTEESPEWDYMRGVEQGWIPRDPAKRTYHCTGI